jgi:hypothetical protein
MLASVIAQTGFVAMAGVTMVALGAGDRWVRWSALLHATNWLLVALCQDHRHPPFQPTNFCIDVVGASAAVLIARQSGRFWAASLAAFQCLGVVSRTAPLIDPSIYHRAAVTVLYVWDAGALISLVGGAAQAVVAKHRPRPRYAPDERPLHA